MADLEAWESALRVAEAGCKTVIGQRLKQSGMEWTVRGADAIISLRCMMKSNRLEDYWESRAAVP